MRFIFAVVLFLATSFPGHAQQILVPPYLQPGNAATLTREQKVLIWETDSVPGNFTVAYGLAASQNAPKQTMAKISQVKLEANKIKTILYRAQLTGLKFDETYFYQLTLNDKNLSEGSFASRTKKPQTRFAVFGDCGAGTPQQAQIAYQVAQQKPQFVLVTGDNVYTFGRAMEYRRRFFPFYLASESSPEKGAALMNSIPFYLLLGNHDVLGADLDKHPDGLAYYYYNDLPLNAPIPALTVEPEGNPALIKTFKKNTSPRFPRMANYSFDVGNVHIACLDANDYINPLDPTLMAWLMADIQNSNADWKLVAYHQPGFNSAKGHYNEQRMRLLAPVCEDLKVDLVLTGHEHNYQRSVPLKFNPKMDETGNHYVISEGKVDGAFTLDENFNGTTSTRPKGIIYIVSGAGGGVLYDKELSDRPDLWKHEPPGNWVPFTTKLISNVHSFTWIETNGKTLTLKQIDVNGKVIDEIKITK